MAALQTLLFLAGLYLGSRHGVFGRQLVSPLAIGLGLIAGHLIFGISLTVTHRSIGDVAGHLIDLGPLWDYIVDNPRVLMQFLNVSIAEEVIYRAGAQPIVVAWLGPWAGIIVVAIVFSLIHEHFFKNAPGQSAEFLAFAILLGILFYWTGNLTLVVAIHAVRNIEIAFIERLVRDDEVKEKGEQPATEEEYLSGECVLTTIVLPGNCDPVWLEWSEETPAAPAPAICGFRQRFQG
jgi:membrane protease YdiL (CAAX protease family)